jgi:conjugal transfer pilin signal peptidase TrbI
MLIRKKEPWSRFVLKAAIGLAIVLPAIFYATSRWEIGIDPQTETSILKKGGEAARVFLVDKRIEEEIAVGDILVIRIPQAAQDMMQSIGFTYPAATMAKRVAAMPGDHVLVDDRGVFVNGHQVASGLILADMFASDRGRLHGETVVPANTLYLLGDASNSFDSRYWGVVSVTEVEGKASVIF